LNDTQILKLLHGSPSEGLQVIIGQYGGILTAIVSRILKNPQDTEECVADTFVDLWRNLDKVKKSESLKGYLICIARNNAINRYNKLKRQYSISYDDLTDKMLADDDVELQVIKKESMREIQKIIAKMKEPSREIFIRKYYLFESVKEIAEKLNLTEVQVKDRLYTSRKALRKQFKESEGIYETYKTNKQYL
jgi:RNA polymerase sigma-70 factor (ECF subfamily)